MRGSKTQPFFFFLFLDSVLGWEIHPGGSLAGNDSSDASLTSSAGSVTGPCDGSCSSSDDFFFGAGWVILPIYASLWRGSIQEVADDRRRRSLVTTQLMFRVHALHID